MGCGRLGLSSLPPHTHVRWTGKHDACRDSEDEDAEAGRQARGGVFAGVDQRAGRHLGWFGVPWCAGCWETTKVSVQRWPSQHPPDELGVVGHGPIILAGSAAWGVVAGLRCVFAHPAGVHLPIVLAASGVYAEAANRRQHQSLDHAQVREEAAAGEVGSDPLRSLTLTVEINGRSGPADPYNARSSGGQDRYNLAADYWIPELPADGRIRITTGWPEIGLTEHTTLLTCQRLDSLATRVYPLITPPPEKQHVSFPESTAPVEVPFLVGLTVPVARQAGHEVGLVVTAADPDGPPLAALTWPGTWVVTAQRPPAGTWLERGDTIVIEFTRRPNDTETGA